MPVLWAYARDLFQTPGFGDTIDFDHIKRHYYVVHRDINPTGIVPVGPDLSGWLAPHGRERLGGHPFGQGCAPGPPSAQETVPAGHTPLASGHSWRKLLGPGDVDQEPPGSQVTAVIKASDVMIATAD